MTTQQTSSKRLHAVAGALLLSLGLLLFFANLKEVAAQFNGPSTSPAGSLCTAIDLGLAGLRAVQAYFFDQPTFQASVHLILVSFWPLVLVIMGGVLLQTALGKRFEGAKAGMNYSSKRARE